MSLRKTLDWFLLTVMSKRKYPRIESGEEQVPLCGVERNNALAFPLSADTQSAVHAFPRFWTTDFWDLDGDAVLGQYRLREGRIATDSR